MIGAVFSIAKAQVSEPMLTLFNAEREVVYRQSSDACSFTAQRLKTGGGTFVPADFDGDSIPDPAFWRPESGLWTIYFSSRSKSEHFRLGTKADVPVPADYDGDGRSDIAVWNPVSGEWTVKFSASIESGSIESGPSQIGIFGNFGDIPMPADYNGDGKAEPAVYRPSVGRWFVSEGLETKEFEIHSTGGRFVVTADYDGDGKADPAVYGNGLWLIRLSSTGETEKFVFGFPDDIPAVADYDGDRKADFATFRDGKWYFYLSEGPRFVGLDFGRNGDVPLASFSAKNIPD